MTFVLILMFMGPYDAMVEKTGVFPVTAATTAGPFSSRASCLAAAKIVNDTAKRLSWVCLETDGTK